MRTCVRVADDRHAEEAHYAREQHTSGGSREQRALRFMAEALRQLERRALEKLPDDGMYPLAWEQGFEAPFRRGEALAYRDAAMRLEHFAEVVERPGDAWTRRLDDDSESVD